MQHDNNYIQVSDDGFISVNNMRLILASLPIVKQIELAGNIIERLSDSELRIVINEYRANYSSVKKIIK